MAGNKTDDKTNFTDLDITSLDDLRGRTPDELERIANIAEAHMRTLHYDDDGVGLRGRLSDAEQTAFSFAAELRTEALNMIAKHQEVRAVLSRRPQAVEEAIKSIGVRDDPYASIRRSSFGELRDQALRILERNRTVHLSAPQQDQLDRMIRRDSDIARRILVTETESYRDAWLKISTQPNGAALLNEDERNALRAYDEYRAMSESTTTAGGFGIPVFIDPSIILTAQESDNPFLRLARQVTVNTNEWKGVSSAGVTWAFQTEGAATTDNSPTLAQPTVHVHMARGLIPFSIEVGQDYPGFADEMARLLARGYDELLVNKFTQGSGTNEPFGILTALSANTNVRVTLTTAGTIGAPDPYKVWQALPQKYRRSSNWLMGIDVNSKMRQLGTTDHYHAYTANLREEWLDVLFGKGVSESPYMPDSTTSTTATTGLAIVGDWENFVVARRGGMSVELVQHIFDVTANMPTGQRAWFGYARIGSDSVNDLGFRLLVNV